MEPTNQNLLYTYLESPMVLANGVWDASNENYSLWSQTDLSFNFRFFIEDLRDPRLYYLIFLRHSFLIHEMRIIKPS